MGPNLMVTFDGWYKFLAGWRGSFVEELESNFVKPKLVCFQARYEVTGENDCRLSRSK